MRNKIINVAMLVLIFLVFILITGYNRLNAMEFLPKPKKVISEKTGIIIDSSTKLVTSELFEKKFPKGNRDVTIRVALSNEISQDLIPEQLKSVIKKPEAYWVKIKDKEIQIIGPDFMGALHGLTTVEYLLQKNSGRIAEGVILDWPDLKIRAFHLILRNGVKFEEAKEFLAKLRYGHYNTLVLEIENWVKLDSMKELVTHKDAWSKEQFVEFVNYARVLGL